LSNDVSLLLISAVYYYCPVIDFSAEESEKYIGRCPKEAQLDQSITAKLAKIREHTLSDSSHSNLKEGVSLSSQDLSRHHEDSGIEMSPMKKDDNLEGEDYLERARKVSTVDDGSIPLFDCKCGFACELRLMIDKFIV